MSDGQALLAVACLIYLVDCLAWLGRRSAGFGAWLGRRWRVRLASQQFGNAAGGLVLLSPLPPLGLFVETRLLPLSLSPDGVCAANLQALAASRAPQSGLFMAFADIRSAEACDDALALNGAPFVRCAGPREARALADAVTSLAAAPRDARGALIRALLEKRLDVDDARERVRAARESARFLRVLCNVLFAVIFLAGPALALAFGLVNSLLPVLALSLLMAVEISLVFRPLHKRLYGDARGERIMHVLQMVLCPPAAIRAADFLTRRLLEGLSPLAAAAALLDRKRFSVFAGQYLRDLAHPLRSDLAGDAAETALWHAAAYLQACRSLADSVLEPPTRLLETPEPSRPALAAYCPRCLAQFEAAEADCPDCTGVALKPFDAS